MTGLPRDRADGDDVCSDDALMARIAAGDHAAFAALSRRHAPRALALVRGFGLSRADQEDVVQEALVRVWKSAGFWDPSRKAAFTTWFHRIVVNLCIDQVRRPVQANIDEVPEPASSDPGPVAAIQSRQAGVLLTEAMLTLPDKQRAALTLCYFGERTAAEAGEILGVSTGSVETMLSRARKSLRKKLAGLGVLGVGA